MKQPNKSEPMEHREQSSFFVYLISTVVICSAVLCSFNWFMNPIGLFAPPVVQGWNHAQLSDWDSRVPRAIQRRILLKLASRLPSERYVFGTSRTRRGFDTCAQDNLKKMALSNLSLSESSSLIAELNLTSNQPLSFYVELGYPSNGLGEDMHSQGKSSVYALFDPAVTIKSIRKLFLSLRSNSGAQTDLLACAGSTGTGSLAANMSTEELDRAGLLTELGANTTSAIGDIIDSAAHDKFCNKLYFFSLPVPLAAMADQRVISTYKKKATLVMDAISSKAASSQLCALEFIDLRNMRLDPHLHEHAWLDNTHFNSELGAHVLNAMLNHPQGRQHSPP